LSRSAGGATSEIGYAGWANLDRPLLDLAGLTNRTIATTAPAADKGNGGVFEPGGMTPTSTVGRVVLAEQPQVMVTIDPQPSPLLLDGRYRLVSSPVFGAERADVYVRSDVTGCG
jgi:hypothetical protein